LNADAAAQSSENPGASSDAERSGSESEDSEPPAQGAWDQRSEVPADTREDEGDERRGEADADEETSAQSDIAPRACVEEAALGEAYRIDQVYVREVHSIGRGLLEISLETPDGPRICTVDRAGAVQSIDEP